MTKPLPGALPAVAIAIALIGSAAAAATPTRQCFRADDIESWADVGPSTVNLRVRLHDYYQLKLLGECRDIDWSQRIGIEHRGSSWICDGLDATLIVPTPIGPRRCPVSTVRKMTPEEVKALPPRQRP